MGNTATKSVHSNCNLGRFVFVAVFLLFSLGSAWAECVTIGSPYYSVTITKTNKCRIEGAVSCDARCSQTGCDTLLVTSDSIIISGSYYYTNFVRWSGTANRCSFTETSGSGCGSLYSNSLSSRPSTRCTNQCDVDSLQCVNSGKEWTTIPGGTCNGKGCLDCDEQCQCEEQPGMIWDGAECVPDTSLCSEYHAMCQKLGGEFSGTPLEDGCSATCNTCGANAQKKILEAKVRSCCNQGLAPEIDEMCYTTAQSGVGMTVSTNANLNCSDPNLSTEAMQSYVDNCSDPISSSSEPGPTSSEGGVSSVSDSAGAYRDYYPILDTIRDSISHIKENVALIATCLTTPGACPGLGGGDSVVVNVPSDSVILNRIATKLDGLNSTLDTSVQNSSDRLGDNITRSISASTDSLIDSMRKYMGAYHGDIQEMDSANRSYLSDIESLLSQIQRDSSGAGRIVGKLDSALGSGSGADTSGVSYNWLQHGEALGDSIVNGSGYGGLDFVSDSLLRDSLLNAGYSCNNDSCCIGSQCVYFDSDSLIEDSLTRYISRMGDSINQKNASYLNDSTTALFSEVQDSLKAFNPLGIFDSTMLNTLGAKIPNTNTCPEHCSRFQVDIPFFFGTRSYTIDFGLCLGRSVFADGNVLSFLRFIIRLIVAITCITAVMWNAARIRR